MGPVGPEGPQGPPGNNDISISGAEGLILFHTPTFDGQTYADYMIDNIVALRAPMQHRHAFTDLSEVPACIPSNNAPICKNGNSLVVGQTTYAPAPTVGGKAVTTEYVAGLKISNNQGTGWNQIGTFDTTGKQLVAYTGVIRSNDGTDYAVNASSDPNGQTGVRVRITNGKIYESHPTFMFNGMDLTLEIRTTTTR